MASEEEEHLRSIAEADLRQAFPTARIIHELTLEQMTCRIDLAAVTPNHIALVEIKSRKDVSTRLKAQISACEFITSDIMIYADVKHLADIDALYPTPRFPIRFFRDGALEVQTLYEGRYQRRDHERHRFNLHEGNIRINPRRLLRLLWAPELKHLTNKGATTRAKMIEICAETMTGAQIRQAVCKYLRQRDFARADPPFKEVPSFERPKELL